MTEIKFDKPQAEPRSAYKVFRTITTRRPVSLPFNLKTVLETLV